MTTLQEIQIRDLLKQGGMLGGFTDFDGNDQPAPYLQLMEFSEKDLMTERGIFIRMLGDSSVVPHLIQQKTIVVGFVTKPDDNDMITGRARAQEIFEYLLDNFEACSIHGTTVTFNGTPFILDSRRRVFEIMVNTMAGRLTSS